MSRFIQEWELEEGEIICPQCGGIKRPCSYGYPWCSLCYNQGKFLKAELESRMRYKFSSTTQPPPEERYIKIKDVEKYFKKLIEEMKNND